MHAPHKLWFALALGLGGCASAAGGHGGMNHAEMMRMCDHMATSGNGQGDASTQPQGMPGRGMKGGMSPEEMQRHCAMMRGQAPQPKMPHDPPQK